MKNISRLSIKCLAPKSFKLFQIAFPGVQREEVQCGHVAVPDHHEAGGEAQQAARLRRRPPQHAAGLPRGAQMIIIKCQNQGLNVNKSNQFQLHNAQWGGLS